jgi:glucose-6-phosphate dehydrogenase assembly protein OpcA
MIASLMHEHPSRAIVIRVRDSKDPLLEARVLAQCWMPFGKSQQICCEQIEITASQTSLVDLPGVVRGLIVPDLPVVLYSPSANLWRSEEFQLLLPLASKLILDSGKFDDPAYILKYLSNLPRGGCRRADLVWGRVTRWREAISKLFDNPRSLEALYSITDVNILYQGGVEPVSVYYLAGWFMHVLGAGVHLNVSRGVGPTSASIARVDLHGPQFEATVELMEPNSLEVRGPDMQQRVVFPPITDCEALRAELSLAERDAIYEDVLGLANLMAGGSAK